MYQKRLRIVFLVALVFSLLTACSPPTLNDMNCQAEDVESDPPFIRLSEDTIVPTNLPFPDQMTNYSRVALSENQVTEINVLCTIRVYESVDLATSALELLCLQSAGNRTEEQFGDAACGFQSGEIREVHFQQGDAVVTVREDDGGAHVGQLAEAVNGRLQ